MSMQASRGVAALFVIGAACGSKREPAPASGTAAATPIDAPGASAPVAYDAAPVAVVPDAPAAVDAPHPGADLGMAPMPAIKTVPPFGCIAQSYASGLAACVAGQRGHNLGAPSSIDLVFVSTGPNAAVADSISLLETTSETDVGPDELPTEVSDEVAKRLQGFVPLTESGVIKSTFTGGKLVMSPALKVKGWTIALKSHRGDEREGAPSFRTELTIRRPGKPTEVLDDDSKTTASIEAHIYDLGDVVIVAQIYDIADEGTSGTVGEAWRCTATACATIE
ncbi:MAG: hypothetical protein K8W52_36835 [Deltaproteobacteria bacterium]|nr:hypothetical protein [Deltaproteobacteria bacterium]